MACAFSVAACTPSSRDNNRIDVKNIGDQKLSVQDKSEQLALAGEQLISAFSFMYADNVFDYALALNPENKRAQFYKAVLSFEMTQKGILNRIKPLVAKTPGELEKLEQNIAKVPNTALKTFLTDGPQDIKTEKDIQDYLTSMWSSWGKLRTFLKQNKNMELTLNIPSWAYEQRVQSEQARCRAEQISEGVFETKECDTVHMMEVKINRADNELMQTIAAGMQMYFVSFIAYDFTGIMAVSEKHKGEKNVDANTVWQELSQYPQFLKLRNTKAMQTVVEMGMDAVAGARWALKIQDQLCPKGVPQHSNRPGFLFDTGICLKSSSQSDLNTTLATVELVLTGGVIQVEAANDRQGKPVMATVKPSALLTTPIADLKSLNPKFNACGNVAMISDDTLGGYYPNHDANYIMSVNNQSCTK